jgi:hypothetical protein
MDFCVRSLLAQQRMSAHRERAAGLTRDGDVTVARLEKMFGVISTSIRMLSAEEKDAAVESLGAAIDRAATDLARTEVSRVRAALSTEVAKLEVQATAERAEIVKALAALLLRHDLPETAVRTHLRLFGGTRYGARLLATTPFGMETVIELEVPSGHLFSSALRVDRVMERLEIQVPESNGRNRGDVKLRPYRFEKSYVAELAIGVTGSAVKLRDAPDVAAAGYDILFGDEQRVRIMRVGEREEQALTDVNESDASRLRSLCERLSAPAVELGKHRKALLEVTLDGQPLTEHEGPAILVERMIQHIAPIVREIARRSSSPDELVLRRLLAEDRREEIFISKAELMRKLEPVPATLRGLFEPLGLGHSAVTTIEADLPDFGVAEKRHA